MNFLAPFFIVGAAAIALPIIFHLVRRTPRDRTVFSSLMFLRPTPPQLTHRSRLEQLLLLMLRCLALALLAFGFARPFFKTPAAAAGNTGEPRHIVLLLDVSASMRRAGIWDAAQEKAAALLRKASPADQIAIYTVGRSTVPLLGFEEWSGTALGDRMELARSRLAAASPGWQATHLGAALIDVGDMLAGLDASTAKGPRQIFLISDLQSGSRLETLQSYEWPKGVELLIEPVKPRTAINAGLQVLTDESDAAASAKTVRVRVSNASDSRSEQFKIGWSESDGGDFATAPVDAYVPPGQSRVVAIPMPKDALGLERIVLRGDDDDFDNAVFTVPAEVRRANILYVGAESADDARHPLFFLKRAVPSNSRLAVSVSQIAPGGELPSGMADASPLWIVTEALPDVQVAHLRNAIQSGKTVLLAPRNAAATALLGPLLSVPSPSIEEVRPNGYAMFSEIDFRHPLFAAFGDPRFSDFTKIHVWRYRRVSTDALAGARMIAKFDTGDPAVIDVALGKGRVIALMTSWSPEDSQLAVSSKFVPLMHALLDLTGGFAPQTSQYLVGESISFARADADVGSPTTVRLPDGRDVVLAAGTRTFADAGTPGIYQFTRDGMTQRVAVNLDPLESRTAPVAADELEKLGAPARQASGEAGPTAAKTERILQAAEAEGRQKLWRWLIGAALAALMIETALAGWSARRGLGIARASS